MGGFSIFESRLLRVICLVQLASGALRVGGSEICCQTLSRELKGKVSFVRESSYNATISSYWSEQEQLVTPSCVVLPASAKDVSKSVKILVAGDKGKPCKFAVKSGGHTPHAGAANIEDGVVIDLGGFKEITLSSDNSIATVGPGNRLEDIYAVCDKVGVSIPGGRTGRVGIGGLTLGGGFGYFATEVGFACDNVLEYEIVLADGSIVYANQKNRPDLWLALKGGGNNFGIVTKYSFRTFPLGQIWAGNIFYPIDTIQQNLEAFEKLTADPKYDVKAGLVQIYAFGGGIGSVVNNLISYAKPVVNPPALRRFSEIQPQLGSTMRIVDLATHAKAESERSPSNFFQDVFAVTFVNDIKTLRATFDVWNASIPSISNVANISWAISIEPMPPSLTSQSTQRGGNVLGLAAPPQGLVLAIHTATWVDPADSGVVNAASRKLREGFEGAARRLGTLHPYIDMNHAAVGQQVIAGYGAKNKRLLQEASRKYDPRGVFQTAVPGGFKVFP